MLVWWSMTLVRTEILHVLPYNLVHTFMVWNEMKPTAFFPENVPVRQEDIFHL